MQNKIALSIIIVNYKSEQYIEKCIASIREKIKNLSFEIIIVNNGKEEINVLLFRVRRSGSANAQNDIKIIDPGGNIGFGRANNLGARKAQGKYILFINPDTLLLTENISKLISEFEKDGRLGIIGPKLISETDEIQWWCAGREINLFTLILNNLGLEKSRKIWESKNKREADWVSGASMFVRRDLFNKLGGFDENFFMYFEDEDLCKRVKQAGYKILYFPEVEVWHLGGKSFENKEAQKKLFYASQDYYFRKHFGKITSWIIKTLRIFISPFGKGG